MESAELGEAERSLWKAFPGGALADLSGTGARPVIRAEVIASLLLGGADPEPGHAPALRLRGADVEGRLDLTGAVVTCPVTFEDCVFDTELCFADSSVRTVRVIGCELPGFDGTLMRLDGLLDLSGSTVAGSVRLEQARVSGKLRVSGTRAGAGEEAVLAPGLVLDGGLEGANLRARGLVSFQAATISGAAVLSRARIVRPGKEALNFRYATVGGNLDCQGLRTQGETSATNCRITASLLLSAARLSNPDRLALVAGGLEAGGGVFVARGFHASGEVRLIGARLAANLTIEGATFSNPGGVALNLDAIRVIALHGEGVSCHGQLSMTGADISGDMNLPKAVLENGDGKDALSAERVRVGGSFVLTGTRAHGEVNLRSIQAGARVLLEDTELRDRGADGVACRLSRARVTSDVFCHRMRAEGSLRLFGSVIDGSVYLEESTLSNPDGNALDAGNLRARELDLRPEAVTGCVDLSHTAVDLLRDDPDGWPDDMRFDGFTYQALEPLVPAARRLRWLGRDPRGFQAQPYEQLAAVYAAHGQPGQAREVQYARERIRYEGRGAPLKVVGLLQDITVGYGYRPGRALAWMALLLVTGSIVFSLLPPPAMTNGQAPHFNGIVYAVDLLLPVVDLGMKYEFRPGGGEQWLSYLLMAAGWILATTVAAGVARVLRRR
ncbi:MAG: hypothetical protein FWE35_20345 [Streptosporangiales bacterium]|nr:hypothetical protein [Streptosporangiales bacterium]